MPTIYELAFILAQNGNGNGGGEGNGNGEGGGEQAAQDPLGNCSTTMILPMVLIFVLFYFMMMRPQAKERAKLRDTLENLKKNDRVVTAGGILGTVVNVQKDSPYVTIKIDEQTNAKLKVKRTSIISVETEEGTEKKEPDKDKQGPDEKD